MNEFVSQATRSFLGLEMAICLPRKRALKRKRISIQKRIAVDKIHLSG